MLIIQANRWLHCVIWGTLGSLLSFSTLMKGCAANPLCNVPSVSQDRSIGYARAHQSSCLFVAAGGCVSQPNRHVTLNHFAVGLVTARSHQMAALAPSCRGGPTQVQAPICRPHRHPGHPIIIVPPQPMSAARRAGPLERLAWGLRQRVQEIQKVDDSALK